MPEEGRGRGSGVRLSAESLAILLISALATDSLSEVAIESADAANAKAMQKKCPVTGKTTFKDALAASLKDPTLGKRIKEINVIKSVLSSITFGSPTARNMLDDKGDVTSLFKARRWSNYSARMASMYIRAPIVSEIVDMFHSSEEDEGGKDGEG